jgi:hypothetical protein
VCLGAINSVAVGRTSTPPAGPQQTNDGALKQAREAVSVLEGIENNQATPPEIRQRNLRNLQLRRLELQRLLSERISHLRDYKAALEAGGLSTEAQEIAAEIKTLGTELASLEAKLLGTADPTAREANTTDQDASSQTTITATTLDGEGSRRAMRGPSNANNATISTPPASSRERAPATTSVTSGPVSSSSQAGSQGSQTDCPSLKSDPKGFSLSAAYVCQVLQEVTDRKRNDQPPLDPSTHAFQIALLAVAKKDRTEYLVDAEERRVDKQFGAAPSNSGTTSLTLKGSGPQILGLAVENGAITQSISGTTVTFSGNPLGIIQALSNKGYIQSYEEAQSYALTRFLKNLSFHLSFDTSRGLAPSSATGEDQPPLILTADRQQLSEVGVRYEFYNQRDPRNPKYRAKWEGFLAGEASRKLARANYDLIATLAPRGRDGLLTIGDWSKRLLGGSRISGRDLLSPNASICFTEIKLPTITFNVTPHREGDPIPQSTSSLEVHCGRITRYDPPDLLVTRFSDDVLQAWLVETNEALMAATDVEAVLNQRIAELPVDQLAPATLALMRRVGTELEVYLREKQKLVNEINQGGIVTFEYTNTRNINSPNLSNFRLIAEKGAGGGFDATFNGSLTIFDTLPAGVSRRVRDFQFSGQLDAIVGSVPGAGNMVLSFSGRYERLMENATALDGTTVPNTKGDIGIGQVKLTIPIKGTGFKIPVSVTFSNRAELIKEREVRGNIGFTFDLDSLFARFKP